MGSGRRYFYCCECLNDEHPHKRKQICPNLFCICHDDYDIHEKLRIRR